MVPTSPSDLLADFPGPMAEIGEWLRGVVHRAIPASVERVRPGWRLIGFDVPTGTRRDAYFAYIAPEPIHIHLGFEHGVSMADPHRLLQGRGITKQVRWVTLIPATMLPEDRLADLLREAARVTLLSRAERLALAELHGA
ncbi:MAG: DUF1801 domain-containing protein [Chloroflexota bacterium]